MVQIDIRKEEEVTSLAINGDVDASSSIQLDESLREVMESGVDKILIDGSNLNYISSAGLGVFMSYIEDLNVKKIKLAIYGLNEKVMNVFEILGLDQLLIIVLTKHDALDSVNEA